MICLLVSILKVVVPAVWEATGVQVVAFAVGWAYWPTVGVEAKLSAPSQNSSPGIRSRTLVFSPAAGLKPAVYVNR